MKNLVKLSILALLALMATVAFAADAATATKLSLHLTDDVSIAGTKLAAGDYQVFVTREGEQAKVRVTDGKRDLVNTNAKFRAMDKFPGGVALAKTPTKEVVELQSKKLKGALVFGSADSAASAESSK